MSSRVAEEKVDNFEIDVGLSTGTWQTLRLNLLNITAWTC